MKKKNQIKRIALSAVFAFALAVTLLETFAIIPSGYTGVRTIFGQVDEKVLSHGIVAKVPQSAFSIGTAASVCL